MSVGGMTRRWFLALGALAFLACVQGLRPGRSGFDVSLGVAVP